MKWHLKDVCIPDLLLKSKFKFVTQTICWILQTDSRRALVLYWGLKQNSEWVSEVRAAYAYYANFIYDMSRKRGNCSIKLEVEVLSCESFHKIQSICSDTRIRESISSTSFEAKVAQIRFLTLSFSLHMKYKWEK